MASLATSPVLRRLTGTMACLALLAGHAPAGASDLLGAYVQAGVARTKIGATVPTTSGGAGFDFSESDSGWKAALGVRAISLFGAELEYVDLGSPSARVGAQQVKADLNAKTLFGLFYLPLPLPLVDIYAKGGYARLDGSLQGTYLPGAACPASLVPVPGCGARIDHDLDDSAAAAGAGVQFRLGSWAVRGEYERFFVSGNDPQVAAISLVKYFF